MKPLDICEMQDRITQLEQKLEVERIRLAACGAVAMANTKESAKQAREMQDEYKSASLDDVIRAVDSEMALRKELNALKGKLDNTFLIPSATVREIRAQAIEDAGLEYMRHHALSSGNPVTLFLKQRAKQLREGAK